jgi:hypothetical protein
MPITNNQYKFCIKFAATQIMVKSSLISMLINFMITQQDNKINKNIIKSMTLIKEYPQDFNNMEIKIDSPNTFRKLSNLIQNNVSHLDRSDNQSSYTKNEYKLLLPTKFKRVKIDSDEHISCHDTYIEDNYYENVKYSWPNDKSSKKYCKNRRILYLPKITFESHITGIYPLIGERNISNKQKYIYYH